MHTKNCIFISVDRRFLPHLKICLRSISKNYINHPDIVVCYTNLTEKDIHHLTKIVQIIPLKNPINSEELWPIMSHLPKGTDPRVFYARFLIRKLSLFQDYDKVLHLDADTIIMKNCDKVFDEQDFYIEQDVYNWKDQIYIDNESPELLKLLVANSLSTEQKAWNAWVFMLPKKYNNSKEYKELMNIVSDYKPYIKRADQSILNIWIAKKWISLSSQRNYNFQHRLVVDSKYDSLFEQASIIHFNWIYDWYRVFCMKLWFYFLRYSLWRKAYRVIYKLLSSICDR